MLARPTPIIFHIVGYIQHLLKLRVLRERKRRPDIGNQVISLEERKVRRFFQEESNLKLISDPQFKTCILKSELGTGTCCFNRMCDTDAGMYIEEHKYYGNREAGIEALSLLKAGPRDFKQS